MLADKKKFNIFSLMLDIVSFVIVFVLVVSLILLVLFMGFNAPVEPKIQTFTSGTDDILFDGITLDDGFFTFEIRRGESAQSVGLRLERASLISSRNLWYLICRFGDDFLKSGTYRIEYPQSQLAIYRILVSGRQMLHRVTIPEGVTLKKTSRIFEDAGICSAADFLASAADPQIISRYRIPNQTMEGYLFPDTYLFPANYPASRVVTAMADNFFGKLENILENTIEGGERLSPDELNRMVILASIVEREYRVPDEAPLMSGVFLNRLRIGMALQSCATVEYIITEIQGKPHPSVILNVDLEIRSPYNTYIMPGLPPGPISAPGAVALRSVFNPQETNFLYFRLTDPQSGRHYFSRTYDEHIRAGQLVPKGN